MAISQDPIADGSQAARRAIAEGFPRWIVTSDIPFGQMIDPATGLPVLRMSSSPDLVEWQASFARAHNETIRAALQSGQITVDFRPLLMSRAEIIRALADNKLGTLSEAQPPLQGPQGDFVLELRFPKPYAKQKLTWILYRRRSGEEWPRFALYDQPLDIATAKEGRVLAFQTACLLLTRDAATTQVLNSYLR
jgi:hypothetical protein